MKNRRIILLTVLCAVCLLFSSVSLAVTGADENEWTVTLNYQDGISRNGSLFVEKGAAVSLPTTAVRKGYTFAGWQTEADEKVENPYTPAADVTLNACWEVGKVQVTLVDSVSGETIGTAESAFGSVLTGVETPVKEGYAFRCWSLSVDGERLSLEETPINSDTTLYACWLEEGKKEFHVVFTASSYSPDHTENVEFFVEEGGQVKKANVPAKLEREGYKFEGWTAEVPNDGNDYTVTEFPAKKHLPELVKVPVKPKADMTLYPVWSIQQYKAIFNANYTDSIYKNNVVYNYDLLASETVVPPTEDPVREGYTFDGWFTRDFGGELADFSSGIKLTANTGFYAHWTKIPVVTDTFQAEYTQFNPEQSYYGYSGSVLGTGCIVKDAGAVGNVYGDEYPTNSKLTAGNKYYVSYQYEKGDTLRFEIYASKAATAKLSANLAVEVDSMEIASTGDNATTITVNGKDIPYSFTIIRIFQEYDFGTIDLVEGLNVIEITVANENKIMGGTYRAVGFMTDCIRITDTEAELSWSPIYDNLEAN